MKAIPQPPNSTVEQAASPSNAEPMPFTPEPDEVPSLGWDAPIEPPPPTRHRIVKGKIRHCGRAKPIPIVDPWE
ncbi:MAG: hypothetical protein HYY24_19305 [Verrucomicrobia bacterium]|nr:hypothetical protein [Verrucomicrobiota bacterium]